LVAVGSVESGLSVGGIVYSLSLLIMFT
jgi:hypothetical protein